MVSSPSFTQVRTGLAELSATCKYVEFFSPGGVVGPRFAVKDRESFLSQVSAKKLSLSKRVETRFFQKKN